MVLKGRSTTNLLSFTDAVTAGMVGGGQINVILTNYSKAFERIDHSMLLDKLYAAGITVDLLGWFTSYIQGRSEHERIGWVHVGFVLPQGSILGPLLFIIFINDINKCFINCDFLLFAADMKIFKIINSSSDSHLLYAYFDRFHGYCVENKLDLNILKCYLYYI